MLLDCFVAFANAAHSPRNDGVGGFYGLPRKQSLLAMTDIVLDSAFF